MQFCRDQEAAFGSSAAPRLQRVDPSLAARRVSWIVSGARLLHRCYKLLISPLFGNVCRFEPYCSDYALQAVETHGVLRGSWLTVKRLLRCRPGCPGGFDPVPPRTIDK